MSNFDYSIYPDGIDGYGQIPLVQDGTTRVNAITVNRLRSAVINIQKELGLLPKGIFASVRARLDAITDSIFAYKNPVMAATTASITLSGGAPDDIDGVTLEVNDRVLVKNQSDPTQNGIYIIESLGTGTNGTWVRADDCNLSDNYLPGSQVFVLSGTTNEHKTFYATTLGTYDIGTTEITWEEVVVSGDGGGTGIRTQFTWKPGATDDADAGIYATWADTHAAAALIAAMEIDVDIIFNTSLSTATIPAGTFNMYRIQPVGHVAYGIDTLNTVTGLTVVSTSTGTFFENWTRGARYIKFTHAGTGILCTVLDETVYHIHLGDNVMYESSGGFIWEFVASGQPVFDTGRNVSFGVVEGSDPLVNIPSGSIMTFKGSDNSAIYPDVIEGAGDLLVYQGSSSMVVSDQSNVSGSVTITYADAVGADALTYSAANAWDWPGTDPTNIKAALDRIGGLGIRSVAVVISGYGGATTSLSSTIIDSLANNRVNRIRVEVLDAYDAGATGKVGDTDIDDWLIAASTLDSTFLSTPGNIGEYPMDKLMGGDGRLKVTTTGASTTGQLRITAFYGIPGA